MNNKEKLDFVCAYKDICRQAVFLSKNIDNSTDKHSNKCIGYYKFMSEVLQFMNWSNNTFELIYKMLERHKKIIEFSKMLNISAGVKAGFFDDFNNRIKEISEEDVKPKFKDTCHYTSCMYANYSPDCAIDIFILSRYLVNQDNEQSVFLINFLNCFIESMASRAHKLKDSYIRENKELEFLFTNTHLGKEFLNDRQY